jgi:hypothetical protein
MRDRIARGADTGADIGRDAAEIAEIRIGVGQEQQFGFGGGVGVRSLKSAGGVKLALPRYSAVTSARSQSLKA